MRSITFSATILLLCSISIFSQEAKLRYAVARLKGGGTVTQSDADLISDRLRIELFKTGKVTILEREEMDNILKEQGFQQSGSCNDEACLVEMGQLLGVQSLVSGSIGSLGKLILLNFRVIDISKGVVSQTVGRDISGSIEGVVTELPSIALELLGQSEPASQQQVQQEQAPAEEKPEEASDEPAKLDIDVYPDDVIVFVDGTEIGVGDTLLEVTAGEHKIEIHSEDKEKSESETVTVQGGETEDVGIRLYRKTYFAIGTNFSFMFGSSAQFGPSAELGLKIKNQYIGLHYYWGAGELWVDNSNVSYSIDYDNSYLFGGGLIYGYVIHIGNIVRITPGISAGYWNEYDYISGTSYSDYDSNTNHYFGGPRLRIQIGYKYIFLDADATLIFGTGGIKPLLNPGISCYF